MLQRMHSHSEASYGSSVETMREHWRTLRRQQDSGISLPRDRLINSFHVLYIPSRASLVPRQAYFRIFSTECHFFMARGLFLQVVHMNPYAAICNEAIDKMMSGEYM